MQQAHTQPSSVPSGAKPEGETQVPQPWAWVEASIWTERMLAALDNGVTGGKWYSLMDKVTTPRTLTAAWKRVAANKGLQEWMVSVSRVSRPGPRTISQNS